FSGNPNLQKGVVQERVLPVGLTTGVAIGLLFLLITAMCICCCCLCCRGEKRKTGKGCSLTITLARKQLPNLMVSLYLCVSVVDLVEQMGASPSLLAVPSFPAAPSKKAVSMFSDAATEGSHCFTLAEIETATGMFVKKVGSGGFGSVFYGKLNDSKEIAVKVLSANSYQGKREFLNEVSQLSRIHHRNLVAFVGYCQEEGKSILVYEFMHNGTLKEHLYGSLTQEKSINWIKRLEIAEDAAKGIEYLHTGCVPTIIHRDLKTSNILLDKNMRAKVSDFGLSKVAKDRSSHVSSMVRRTFGYLDPEYHLSQQLTAKSDVYSFGVIMLELISGQEAILKDSFGANFRHIVPWVSTKAFFSLQAKLHVESGDIQQIIDPSLRGEFDIQSVWKISEKAMMCVKPHGKFRPTISEVLKEIQEAISIEREGSGSGRKDDFEMLSTIPGNHPST
ncbi:putative LRR receptor-like serine/threonine-protein kinase, partial [Nymphaea thermarum]